MNRGDDSYGLLGGRKEREERLRKLLEERAHREGKTVEQVVAELKDRAPLIREAVQAFRGKYPEVPLPEYPGPDCLEPCEIGDDEFRSRLLHVLECQSCAGLIVALGHPKKT